MRVTFRIRPMSSLRKNKIHIGDKVGGLGRHRLHETDGAQHLRLVLRFQL